MGHASFCPGSAQTQPAQLFAITDSMIISRAMTPAARILEPLVLVTRLAAILPQMALHPLIRRFAPALDGSVIMNASSPMRDTAFRQFLCDRTLDGKTAATV